uniref:Serpin peptidase inhibitor, clade B (ovalbumin), member 1 n=1 Tax=Gadus morhua TaxID=8049 RepID=A0A8C5FPA2_GADMO
MTNLGSSNSIFALDIFRTLSQASPKGNVFLSPLSISSALAMVYLGAKGDTASQMQKVPNTSQRARAVSCLPMTTENYEVLKSLDFNCLCIVDKYFLCFSKFCPLQTLSFSSEDIHTDFQTLNVDINSSSTAYILKLANRLYGENNAHFLPKFYNADLKAVDFIGAPEDCRVEINDWVEQQTENKIKDLLKSGTVTPMTRLALVNAIYFKGIWLNQFEKANTKQMVFKLNQSKPVEMMYQMKKLPFNYIPDYSLQILELPYVKEELSMFVLLPEESTDGSDPLLKLEKELTQEKLDEWTNRENMDTQSDVLVHLPKFKLEEDYELKEALGKMGMTDVFIGGKADLSGMNREGGLFLSTVAHKAFVEVNEEGTEAAAATAGMISFCMLQEEHFTADHPFLFFIRHNKTKSILFFGRFSSPQ